MDMEMTDTHPSRLTPEDAFRHELPDHEAAREALYWTVLLPDEQLGIAVYFYLKPTGEASNILLAYGPDLEPYVFDFVADVTFEGKDLDDFRVGRASARQPDPLRTWEVAYQGDRLSLDFSYTAIHEPFDYWQNPNGSPLAFTSGNRIEQSGVIEGTVVFDGRRIPFHTTGHHDHSWGMRDWKSMLHYKWIGAQAGPELSLHAAQVIWRGRVMVNGYAFRDGLLSPIVDGRFEGTYDADVHTRTSEIELIDAAGRTTRASAERFAGAKAPFPGVLLTETACRFEIDGRPGVGVVEMLFPEGYGTHVAANWPELSGS